MVSLSVSFMTNGAKLKQRNVCRPRLISVAQTIRHENEQLKALLKSGNSALFDVTKAKNDADLSQAQSDLTKAYDEGNAEEIVSAQTQLNELMFDGRKLQEAISQREFLAQSPAPCSCRRFTAET